MLGLYDIGHSALQFSVAVATLDMQVLAFQQQAVGLFQQRLGNRVCAEYPGLFIENYACHG
mgnify:CR=1 FL=1